MAIVRREVPPVLLELAQMPLVRRSLKRSVALLIGAISALLGSPCFVLLLDFCALSVELARSATGVFLSLVLEARGLSSLLFVTPLGAEAVFLPLQRLSALLFDALRPPSRLLLAPLLALERLSLRVLLPLPLGPLRLARFSLVPLPFRSLL